MDPPLVNESSFSAANPAAYSLAEIWPFGGAGIGIGIGGDHAVNGALRLRMGNSGSMNGMYGENIDGSVEESSVTEQSMIPTRTNSRRKKKDAHFQDDSSHVNNNCIDDLKTVNGKRMKTSGSRDENEGSKAESESNSGTGNKQAGNGTKPSEPPKQDYIHVRARRGQATDSHSLAERARREKISERMKVLQDLVPGCNKVIGKALVLDEIINYIQSLQHQVEFLSMKLEAVNSRTTPTIEAFPHKDVSQLRAPAFDAAGMMFSSHAQGPQSEWLHMQLGGNFERSK